MSGSVGGGGVGVPGTGGVDSNIALQAGRGGGGGAANPLMSDPLGTMGKLNQLQLFPLQQQQLQQQLELGRLGITGKGIENQRLGLGLSSDQIKLAQQQGSAAYGFLMPYANQETVSFEDVQRALGLAASQGLPVDKPMAELLKYPPPADGNYAGYVKQHVVPYMSEAGQLQVLTPRGKDVGAGGSTVVGTEGALFSGAPGSAGTFTPKQVITSTVGPEYRATPQTRQEGANAPVTAPGETFAPPSTLAPTITPITPGGAATGPATAVPGGGGVAPSSGGVPGAGGAPTKGMAPGEPEAIKIDVDRYKADQAAIPNRQTATQTLQKALDAYRLTSTGKSTEAMHNLYSFLVAQGLDFGLADKVENWDLARKYATDYAMRAAGGAGTDLRLRTSEEANASNSISNDAAIEVLKTNLGRERQAIGMTMEAPETGRGYGTHTTKFSNDTDPRAFAYDSYTPTERSKLMAQLKKDPAALDKFDRSLEIAHRLKLIHVPGAPSGQ